MMECQHDNWAHDALVLMDEVDALVRWAAVSHPDPGKYKTAAKAFWDVCNMLAEERTKLHNAAKNVDQKTDQTGPFRTTKQPIS